MPRQRPKKARANSVEWFATALDQPAFVHLHGDIRIVCAIADSLHRTVSGVEADRTKRRFLNELRMAILHSDKTGIDATVTKIGKTVAKATSTLVEMNSTPAQNPSDWSIGVHLAQVKSENRIFARKRGFQGGAPQ
jgi:hypothetical protein